MFNAKDAGRLFQEDWKTPAALARQLYQMVTSKEPKTVNAPVEISVPKGQTALRISQAKAPAPPPPSPAARNRTTTIADQARLKPVLPGVDEPSQTRNPSLSPFEIRPQKSGIDHASAIRIDDHVDTFRSQSDQPPIGPPRPFKQPPTRNSSSQVQSGPDGQGSRPGLSASQSNFSKAYKNPIFEVAEGDVKFSGISPVQFDRVPYVFNFDTDQYEPMGRGDGSTAQPAFAEGSQSWGQVVGGTGKVQMVTLYDDPDPLTPPGDTVSCTFPMLDDAEQIPLKTWVYPIFVNGDGAYFCTIPVWLG